MTTPRPPWLAFLKTGSGSGHAVSPSCNHTTYSGIVLAGLARATPRAKSRGWSVTRDGTSSFRFRSSRASKRCAYLVECCRRRMADHLCGHNETIAQRGSAILPRSRGPCRQLRRLREGRDTSLVSFAGLLPAQRLLGPDDIRSSRRACLRVCPILRRDAHVAILLKGQAPVGLAQLISGVAWRTLRSAERPNAPGRAAGSPMGFPCKTASPANGRRASRAKPSWDAYQGAARLPAMYIRRVRRARPPGRRRCRDGCGRCAHAIGSSRSGAPWSYQAG
jgi:hypothetical protein